MDMAHKLTRNARILTDLRRANSLLSAVSTLLIASSSLSIQGQGYVQFRNYYTAQGIDAPVYLDYIGGVRLAGTNYRAGLIGGPTTATPASLYPPTVGTLSLLFNPNNTTLTWVNFRTGTNAGYVTINQPAREVLGVDWGLPALVQMVVWTGDYDTWADAFAAFNVGTPGVLIGVSKPLILTLPSSIYSTTPTYLVGLESFALYPCHGDLVFTAQPVSQAVLVGQPVEFSVTAYDTCGAMLYYQWYRGSPWTGSPIDGATASTYQIPSPQPADAGSYYVLVSGNIWGYPGFSGSATLTVRSPPIITSQPQSQTAVTGSSAAFRVSASGDAPLGYRWSFNGSTPIPGNVPTLNLPNLQSEQVGAYCVVVSNAWGTATSAPAMLNVIPPVPLASVPAVVARAESGTALNLEYADAFASITKWQALAAVTLGTNTSQLYLDWPASSLNRYYRATQTNGVSWPPLLSLQLIPAITLTGAIGDSVRVDYINQIGPTDAWATLATVTLTNTAQQYFDTSAIGQPPRLYRLTPGP